MADRDELVFLPLGGVGEIGMNLGLYGIGPAHDRSWLMVDLGITFGDETTPGVDLIYPDISFIEEERHNLVGIVLTHAHEDHYGAVLDLWPRLQVPVYATAFTAGLLEAKALENRVGHTVPVTTVDQGARLSLGPFDVEFVAMSHSIPEPNALVIRTRHGTVVHSGDWKIDLTPGLGRPIDIERLKAVGDEGVRALVCDSTNAVRSGRSPSEAEVGARLTEIVKAAPNRVAVTTFASNVARLKAVAMAAQAAGREVVVIGRAMKRVIDVARELGYLEGAPNFLDEEAYGYLPRDKVVALLTGSQGESRAALARIAADDHPRVALSKGDLVIFSSRTIPGNESSVISIVNQLAEQGIEILTDQDDLVHVSGHPRRDELADLYSWIRPEVLIPVHGEPFHLEQHARFAKAQGIPEVVKGGNGDVFRLAPGPATVVDELDTDILYKDGHLILAPAVSGADERRKLSFAGCVIVNIVLDGKGNLATDPAVAAFGIPSVDRDGDPFPVLLQDAVEEALDGIPRPRRRDRELVAKAARRAVRSLMNARWGKKPLCRVEVTAL
ncbi:ribonuclease J [Amorphus orientalis]|uniref:Ribonuclease J n=1 Tax=Amorphus orientalis TaxID=649198 RepID=A0AAE4ATL6_9HYPH|nr:ribonuclease J [Amorphus orientalis]MDQ0316272.1 ribonuclease J [Amorphus orientalis]